MVQVKSGKIPKISYNKSQKGWRFFMSKQYDKQFKEDAVKYYLEHKELGLLKCAGNLGISKTALGTWTKAARENHGEVPVRGPRKYSSDEAKEIARLKRELKDTQDALEILKKATGILGNWHKLVSLKFQKQKKNIRWNRNTGLMSAGCWKC